MGYQRLKSLVADGKLSLFGAIGMPRTISTAAAEAIGNSPSLTGRKGRPFADVAAGFDAGCEEIRKRVEQHRVSSKAQDFPAALLIKDTARRIGDEDWIRLAQLFKAVAFAIRDPHLQCASVIERLANDLKNGYGSSELSFDECMARADEVDAFLRCGGMVGSLKATPNYKFLSWSSQLKHVRHFARLTSEDDQKGMVIVPGTLLQASPYQVMQHIAREMKILFSPDMVIGWTKTRLEGNYITETPEDGELRKNSWVKEAYASKGIKPPNRHPLPLEAFPPGLRKYIECVALPAYVEMMAHEKSAIPKDGPSTIAIIDSRLPSSNERFYDKLPITAYCLLKIAEARIQEPQKDDAIAVRVKIIRNRFDDLYNRSFDIIDQNIESLWNNKKIAQENRETTYGSKIVPRVPFRVREYGI